MTIQEKLTTSLNAINGLTQLANSTTGESDSNIGDAVASLIAGYGGGGGLPSGFTAIATGTHTLSADVPGGDNFTVNHNLGYTPDMFIFYHEGNIAQTNTMMMAIRCNTFNWRGSSYLNQCTYHSTATTNVSTSNVTTSYGIKTLSSTSAVITTYSASTSYFWRAGTYKWIAIKF